MSQRDEHRPTNVTSSVASLPLPAQVLAGRTLGDFRILRHLGQGGMGHVYLAEQISLQRKVALKILRADLAADVTYLQRFQAEALAVAQATHANIVQVYAIGEADGLHFMALEYIEGRNLREQLSKKGPPDILLALSIMRQVAAALQRSGELGIIHRDIKPENILLTRKGEVKVADFGLSRCLTAGPMALHLTQTGVTMGTPLYMSPEQVEGGKSIDFRSDIYSFGVTCYHMLTGDPPFRGDTAFEVALQHVQASPEPLRRVRPDLPLDLCVMIHKMMAKNPQDRYQTARDLLKDIVSLRESLNVTGASTPTRIDRPAAKAPVDSALAQTPIRGETLTVRTHFPPRRRHHHHRRRWLPWMLAASPFLAFLLGGAAVWMGTQRARKLPPPEPPPPDRAQIEAIFSPQEQEKSLRAAIEPYAAARTDADVRTGLGLYVQLALLYLDQERLRDAAHLFDQLNRPEQVSPYQALGRAGQAIVLAMQNHAAESNALLVPLFSDNKNVHVRMGQSLFMRQYPPFRAWVLRALHHNHENSTPENPFPRDLEHLLKGGGMRPRPPMPPMPRNGK